MNGISRSLLVLSILVALLPALTLRAQDGGAGNNRRMDREFQAQVIAHGVADVPGQSLAWELGLREAPLAGRGRPVERPAGFLLSDGGNLAVTDRQGTVLQRLTPGAATWLEPGQTRGVVSLDARRRDYYQIGLVAPNEHGEDGGATLTHEAFAAPVDRPFAVDILRGLLDRGEEHDIPGNETPMLVLVTSGRVFLETEDGILELSTGESVQTTGPAVVIGASRATAAYAVARIGPAVPRIVRLTDATPVAAPRATPVASPRESAVQPVEDARITGPPSLVVPIRACPDGMTPEHFAPEVCGSAPPGTSLSLRPAGVEAPLGVGQALPEAWSWQDLEPGSYHLAVNALPEGFVAAALDRKACCDGEDGFSLHLSVDAGRVERTLYLFPPPPPREISLTIDVLACPAGMTGETLIPEWCLPAPPGTILSLSEWGTPLGVSAFSGNTWNWQALGSLTYRLQVHALPPGFTAARLEQETCCPDADGFDVTLEPGTLDARRTLFLFQPPGPDDAGRDSDADGLLDVREADIGTHPFRTDTDDDGIADGDEVDFYGTDPLRADTDGDRLTDAEELLVTGTNPLLADTDGDGVSDAQEIAAGSDPLDFSSAPVSPDPTPIATPLPAPAAWPVATLTVIPATPLPPVVASPVPSRVPKLATPGVTPGADSLTSPEDALDGDGLSALDEIAIHGTSPTRADTDGDAINDGDEVAAGRDPRDPAN